MVFVFYKIQTEDATEPNVFSIESDYVALKDIVSHFPDRTHSYHFRFKTLCNETGVKQ